MSSEKLSAEKKKERRRKRQPVREALKSVNRYYDGCQGVITSTEEAYYLTIDTQFSKKMRVALSLADKLKDVDLDYRFDIAYKNNQTHIKVEFPPYEDGEFGGLM